ncbi:ISKra4 family transposase [Acrocarpospora sp. B8E8]|uniref:ISKra4 family transposase n=1 Tax=Acrocarpospora sp. B8E8 TaxID=3153572 RepID=UPI00325DCB56
MFAAEVDRLAELAAAASGADGAVELEIAIRTAMLSLGAELLQGLLAADAGHRGQVVDCGAGHDAQFVSYRDKKIDTVLGSITLPRAYYHCPACGCGVVPRDTELGIAGASLTPGLRAMMAHAGAALPFARATALVNQCAGLHLNARRLARSAEADGTRLAEINVAEAQAINRGRLTPLPPPAGDLPDKLYIEIDGTGVPMRPDQVTDRAGKGADGRARTREIKLACLFTQTRCDDDGRPVRDGDSSSYVATFDPAADFAPLVAAEARRRGADHIRQLIVIGDGAKWIWNLAGERFGEATQIVDLYHAREHLHDLADHLAFITPDPARWRADRLKELDDGDITAIIDAARAYPLIGVKATELDTKIGYFEANAHRMNYAHFRDLGMSIGSGAVEGACKSVIGARLKQSGMRWAVPGAHAIAELRCQDASGSWDAAYNKINNQTRAG